MLTFLRKAAKSLPAKLLIAMLVGSFAIWGVGDIFRFRPDKSVASVGDTEVSAQRFADILYREQTRLTRESGQPVSIDMMRAAGIDRRILGGLLRDAAYDEELRKFGLAAPDSAVAEAIRSNPSFEEGGKFSKAQYNVALVQARMTPIEFEALTRTLLAQQIITETVEAAQSATPGAAARIAAWQGEARAVTTLTLPIEMAPEPGQPDAAALQAFYDAHGAMFTEPERRWGEYLHVDAAKLMAELRPDDATLRQAYDTDIAAYTVEPKRTIDQILYPDRAAAEAAMARLASGDATFESLGTEAGLDAAGLSLGEVLPSDLPDAAAAAVFASDQPGPVGPVALPAGFAVFHVRQITPGGTTPFDEVKDQIAERLEREALVYRAPELANQIEELRAEGLTMAEMAEKAGVAYGKIEGLGRDGTLPGGAPADGFIASDAFLKEAFAALDLEERQMAETPEGGYFLVMIQRIEPSALQPLDKVRDKAIAAWQEDARKAALLARGQELAARLGQDASIWDIGEELGLAARPHPAFPRYAPPADLPPDLVAEAFKLQATQGAAAASTDGSGVVIGQVAEVKLLEPAEVELMAGQFDALLTQGLTRDIREYFSQAIAARHEVRIEAQALDTVYRQLGGTSGAGQ